MLTLQTPLGCDAERLYVADVLLREVLGLEYRLEQGDRRDVLLRGDGERSGEIILPDVLFAAAEDDWLTSRSLPRGPVPRMTTGVLAGGRAPVDAPALYTDVVNPTVHFDESARQVRIDADLFGGAFFLLTRYEECVVDDHDVHGRFAASSSLAAREGFLDCAVVNEYVEILWNAIRLLWPQMTRKPREPRVLLSHDVDRPWEYACAPWTGTLTTAAADVLKRVDPCGAARRLRDHWRAHRRGPDEDRFNSFDWMMNVSERQGLRSAFYFITAEDKCRLDGNYDFEHPWVRRLLGRIHERGHEIGFHPSYRTFLDAERTKREFERLKRVCESEGIRQDEWGGRQHFLRWRNPTTWQNWEDAGLSYDSTLTFADHAGFRCGTCYEFPVFNLKTGQALNLRERPLIVMEGSLLEYMGLTWEQAYEQTVALADVCKRYDGDFTLLWHNSSLATNEERTWYERIIERIA